VKPSLAGHRATEDTENFKGEQHSHFRVLLLFKKKAFLGELGGSVSSE
jgi:hypothetical protein